MSKAKEKRGGCVLSPTLNTEATKTTKTWPLSVRPCGPGGKASFYFLIFKLDFGERDRKTSICCSTYLCIYWLIPVWALTGDKTHSLGVWGPCSNPLRHPAWAEDKFLRTKDYGPGWCSSVGWAPACQSKGHRCESWSEHTPGLQARSLGGGLREATNRCFACTVVFLSLFLPSSPSL